MECNRGRCADKKEETAKLKIENMEEKNQTTNHKTTLCKTELGEEYNKIPESYRP